MELVIFTIGTVVAVFTPLTLTTCWVAVAVALLTIWGVRLYRAPMTWAEGRTWLLSFAGIGALWVVVWSWSDGFERAHLWVGALAGFASATVGLFAERGRERRRMTPADEPNRHPVFPYRRLARPPQQPSTILSDQGTGRGPAASKTAGQDRHPD